MTTLGCLASYSLMSALFNVIIGGGGCVQNVRGTLLEPAPLLLQAAVVSAASASVMAAAVLRKCFIGAPSSAPGAVGCGGHAGVGAAEMTCCRSGAPRKPRLGMR